MIVPFINTILKKSRPDVLKQGNWENASTFINTILKKSRPQELSVRNYY